MSPDFINGVFELVGGGLLFLNVRRLWIDATLKGVDWKPTAFYAVWGLWNLYFYPALDQWWSFAGGIVVVVANLAWLGLLGFTLLHNWFMSEE